MTNPSYGETDFLPLRVYPNLNGTAIEDLRQQRMAVVDACNTLLDALNNMIPHRRDFRQAPAGAFEIAQQAWHTRFSIVQALRVITSMEAWNVSYPAAVYVPICAIAEQSGHQYWYTGNKGTAWISRDKEYAFLGYTVEAARDAIKRFNADTTVTGLRFFIPQNP